MPGDEAVRSLRLELKKALDRLRPEVRREALTHVSYANEKGDTRSNERLEYLGDAVLYLSVGKLLYDGYPDASEGDLTRMRARLVSGAALASIADAAGLGRYLRLGRGEKAAGGRFRPSILAGALEAVAGALFLERGWKESTEFVRKTIMPQGSLSVPVDAKTLLQEKAQAVGGLIEYRVISQKGPDHMPCYTIACLVDGREVSRGRGGSKKEAEEEAAAKYLRLG